MSYKTRQLTSNVITCKTFYVKKEKTSPYTLRLPNSLREELEKICEDEDRTLSNQIIVALRRFVKSREEHIK